MIVYLRQVPEVIFTKMSEDLVVGNANESVPYE